MPDDWLQLCLFKKRGVKNVLRNTDGADMAGLMAEAFWSLGKKVFFIETF